MAKKIKPGHNLKFTPNQPVPGPKHALAKAGVPQPATNLAAHRQGGHVGGTQPPATPPYSGGVPYKKSK